MAFDFQLKSHYLREVFKKNNCKIREFVSIGSVGGHLNPKFQSGVYILPKNLISCHRTIFSSEFKPRISEIKNQSDLPQKWKTLLICATKISNFQKMQEMCKISEKCFYLCMFHHSYCHIDTYFKMTFWFPVVRTARKFELSPHLQDLVN